MDIIVRLSLLLGAILFLCVCILMAVYETFLFLVMCFIAWIVICLIYALNKGWSS